MNLDRIYIDVTPAGTLKIYFPATFVYSDLFADDRVPCVAAMMYIIFEFIINPIGLGTSVIALI